MKITAIMCNSYMLMWCSHVQMMTNSAYAHRTTQWIKLHHSCDVILCWKPVSCHSRAKTVNGHHNFYDQKQRIDGESIYTILKNGQKIRPATLAYFQLLWVWRASAFSQGLFCPLGQKKRLYYAVLTHFCQFLVSSSNLGNFQQ